MKYYAKQSIPNSPKTTQKETSRESGKQPGESPSNKTILVPSKVIEVYNYIIANKQAPKGFVGGRIFANREKRLPITDSSGKKLKYQEWDVNPKEQGKNRGAERLITCSDNSAYYTSDHYKTFTKFK
ncbi:MAG: ribonuclease [Saprospiraceae bacterium]|nr:ribonuclease [Saprospiraceae bacterium]